MWARFKPRLVLAARVLLTGAVPPRTRREIPALTPAEVAEARAFFPLDKFFIFGHARSGTTLLTRLIRLHPQVHCNYQAHFFTRPPLLEALVSDPEVAAWLAHGSNRWNQGGDLSPLLLRAAADFILEREARPLGKRVVGDKSPNSLLNGESVRLMHKIYPDGRLFFIVRDGRDTALSHRFQAFIDTPQQLANEDLAIRDGFMRDPDPFLRGERSVFTEKGIRQAAESWVCNVVQTDQAGRELYGDRYHALRYEDVLSQAWRTLEQAWSFLGVDPPEPALQEAVAAELSHNLDAEWQQHKAGEIARSLQKGKHGSWQQMFTRRDRRVFAQVAGGTLKTWGYED
jgi:hypothetical protein